MSLQLKALSKQAAKGRVGAGRLTAQGTAAVSPLTIILTAITLGFGVLLQPATPAGYLMAAGILAVFAVGLTAMAEELENAGAFYSYVAAGLNKTPAAATALIALAAYTAIAVGLYGAFGPAADRIWRPTATDHAWWSMWALIGWALITGLSMLRIRTSTLILGVFITAEIGYVLALNIVLLLHPADGYDFSSLSPAPLLSATGMGSLMGAITGFVGFEILVTFTLVAVHQGKTVGRAIRAVLTIAAVLYGGSGLVMVINAGPDRIIQLAQQHPTDLFFRLAAPYVPAEVITLGQWLFVGSVFFAILAITTTVSRYTLTLAREGVLPASLRITFGDEVPFTAGLTQAGVTLVALVVCSLAGADPTRDLFFYATTAGGLGVLICMTLTAVAIAVYFHRHPGNRHWTRRRLAPWAAIILLTAVTLPSIAFFGEFVNADGIKAWAPITVYLAIGTTGVVWARRLRTHRPAVYAAIGNGGAASRDASPAEFAPRIERARHYAAVAKPLDRISDT